MFPIEKEAAMSKLTYYGLCSPQDPVYGTSHTNIVKKLTRNNWRCKAIVRSSSYIWLVRGSYREGNRKVYRYYIKGIEEQEFRLLSDALKYVNEYSDYEGDYPNEEDLSWTVSFGIGGKY